jgi:hypothetical protein
MTFLAPIFLYIGLGVAAGAIALHFIVTRQPTSSPLPTVRFIPVSAVRVTTVAPIPEDLLLLLVRVLAAILIGAAFARPVLTPTKRPVARIVMADVSRGVGDIAAVRDSARALLAEGDALIAFDSSAHVVRENVADSAARLARSERQGRFSPALIAALRTSAELRAAADSIELVLISPLRSAEMDGATHAIRALWNGRMRIVRVPASSDSLPAAVGLAVRGAADDGVALAASVNGLSGSDSAVRIMRGAVTAADSVWASTGRHTLVRWPANGAPPGWIGRAQPDTMGAVVAGEAALVFPLERRWQPDSAANASRVAAHWVDGAPAAVERSIGSGCVRDVAIPVPTRGDLVLRPEFARLVRALGAPCDAAIVGFALPPDEVAMLAGIGPLVSTVSIRPPDVVATPLVPWLVVAALLLVPLEIWVRRGSMPLWTKLAAEEQAPRASKRSVA